MRKQLLGVSATLALTLIVACGGSTATTTATSTPSTTCVNAAASHRAYLVVQHGNGTAVNRCVGFDGAQLNGDDLMKQSGIEFQTQTFSFGKGMCQVDNEPVQFSECFPKNQPFWSLYQSAAGQPWVQAQTGYSQVDLKDGEAMGWTYASPAASPSPPPLPKK